MTSHKEQPAVDTSAEKIARQIEKLEKRAAACRQTHNDFMAAEFEEYAASLRSLAAHPAEPAGTAGIELETTAEERERWAAGYGGHALAMLARDFVRLSTQLRDAQARGKGMEEALKPIRQRLKAALHRDPDCTDYANLAIAEQCVATALDDIDAALSRPEGSASK